MARRKADSLLPPAEPNPLKGKKGRSLEPAQPKRPFVPPKKVKEAPEVELTKTPVDQALFADGKKLALLNNQIKDLEKEVTEAKGEREKLSLSLHERMLKLGYESIKLAGIGTMTRQMVPFPHFIPGLEAKAMDAIRKLGYGALIKETIHHRSLQSMVKEIRARNIKQVFGLEIYDKPAVRIYSNSSKKQED